MHKAEYDEALKTIAQLTDGEALVVTEEGQPLFGEKRATPHAAFLCLQNALRDKKPVATSRDGEAIAAAIYIGGKKWLLLDNSQKASFAQKQKQAIIDALPFIAQIAGGDATMFNEQGIREYAFFPDRSMNTAGVGEYKELYARTLKEMRPSIGPSFFAEGASAVRFPITREYGVAFNNQRSRLRQAILLDKSRQNTQARYQFEDIVGHSAAINQARKIAQTAAKTNSTVLLEGETGTGKEMFAQAIHNASERAMRPFVAINCGAIPENLVESILFGYEEGAFTGAKKAGNVGAFEQADSGTLFLDEISEMPYDLQVRLLRAIQEREITRVGARRPRKIDVRIIAATNHHIKDMVEAGKFRADLYFRLNVLTVQIPSLRERTDDITPLLDYFLHKFARLMNKSGFYLELDPLVLKIIRAYPWPGNVRELQNTAEYIVNMLEKGDDTITVRHLPYYLLEEDEHAAAFSGYEDYMYKREHEFLQQAFQRSEGNKSLMAKQLGVNRTTLFRMLKKHHIG
jgi:DNA-binding NtrC family response regulator